MTSNALSVQVVRKQPTCNIYDNKVIPLRFYMRSRHTECRHASYAEKHLRKTIFQDKHKIIIPEELGLSPLERTKVLLGIIVYLKAKRGS